MSRVKRREHGTGHVYHLDGEKVAGVTTAINVIAKEALTWWSAREAGRYAYRNHQQWMLLDEDAAIKAAAKAHDTLRREAAARGTRTHELVVPMLRGEPVDPPEDPAVYWLTRAAQGFIDGWRFAPILTETVVYSATHRYAGTLDLVGTSPLYPGRVFLADWKTNASTIYPEAGMQLAAYANAEFYVDADDEDQPMRDLGITDHLVVWLHDDGTFTVQETSTEPEAFELFLAALNLYDTKARVYDRLLGPVLAEREAVA